MFFITVKQSACGLLRDRRSRLAVVALALFALGACDGRGDAIAVFSADVVDDYADLVFVNGGIYTVDAERPWAEAAAIRSGQFVAVGSNSDVEAFVGPDTQRIDLTGHLALPGFHDAHVHPGMGGMALLGCNLAGLDSVDAILAAVAGCAKEGDGWIRGYAFDLGLFGQEGPHHALLDPVTGDRPAFLEAADGHNAWVNARALELAAITADTPAPALGVIERDPDGAPTGTLRESAMALVTAVMPVSTPEENAEALLAGIRHLNGLGITSFIDASVGESDYVAYGALHERGELSARVLASLTWGPAYARHTGADFERVLEQLGQYESAQFHTGSIKIFLDGVLEGETAALVEPYLNMGHHQGELIVETDALAEAVTRFDALGLQVHMHAIGDGAVREGLDAIAAARSANGIRDNRHHIAHLQLVHSDDIPRFAALDVSANFQPLWAYPDDFIMNLNLPVVGEARVQRMYPIASVQRAGGRIVGGSDWNVSSANPLDAIETALRRQDAEKVGGAVLNAQERVDLKAMIEAYTINAAWLMKQEDSVGSIEPGKRADIVVLDRNLFTIPVTEINETRVLMTFLDGEALTTAPAEQETSVYVASEDPMLAVQIALDTAKSTDKLLLIVMGAQWCHDSLGLAEKFKDPEVAKVIAGNYVTVFVDVGYFNDLRAISQRFDQAHYFATPTVMIVNADTERLINAEDMHIWGSADQLPASKYVSYFTAYARNPAPQFAPLPDKHAAAILAFEQQNAQRLNEAYEVLAPRMKTEVNDDFFRLWREVREYRTSLQRDIQSVRQQAVESPDQPLMLPSYDAFSWEDAP